MGSAGGAPPAGAEQRMRVWQGLDAAAMLGVPLALFFPWLLLILALVRDRQPGVICLTPAFWLLGLVVGLGVVRFSRSQSRAAVGREALAAGGLFGLLCGATFLGVTSFAFGADAGTRWFGLVAGLLVTVIGMGVCAGLAGALAWWATRGSR